MDKNNIELYKVYTGSKEPVVISKRIDGCTFKYVPFDITFENDVYSWKYLLLRIDKYNYEGLVSKLISDKYTLRDSIVILSNYLLDSTNEKYKKEFDELQKCRIEAKEFAKRHFNMI